MENYRSYVEHDWTTEVGYPAQVVVHEVEAMRWRCGYVQVPLSHPWCGKPYDNWNYEPEDAVDIEVHGGLTFSGHRKSVPGWWFGWDYNHGGDVFENFTWDEVSADCEYAAAQLKGKEVQSNEAGL